MSVATTPQIRPSTPRNAAAPQISTANTPAPATADHTPAAPAKARLQSVDLLRGLVMMVMVLDHVRIYFSGASASPTDIENTTPALFFTRWITHFCAPAFVFLAGTGVYLSASKGKPRGELARFLVSRGLWLVFLDLMIVRVSISFSLQYETVLAGVLWAIGWSMVVLAGLIWFPKRWVAATGFLLVVCHNSFDALAAEEFGPMSWVWKILHDRGRVEIVDGISLNVLYPLIPWVGVMALGYTAGIIFTLDQARRRTVLRNVGLGLVAAFLVLRGLNLYGDSDPWAVQDSPLYTVMSFLNCTKYPPSLLFLLMTLGPVFLALSVLDREAGPVGRRFVTLGRVPLFYYLLQWPLAHVLAIGLNLLTGQPTAWLFDVQPFEIPEDAGYSLPVVYGAWLTTVALLYPACIWFADLKKRRNDFWLRYF